MTTIDLKSSDRLILRRICGCSTYQQTDPECVNCKGSGSVDQLITPEELYAESFGKWFQSALHRPEFKRLIKNALALS